VITPQTGESASQHFDAIGDPFGTRVFIWAMAYAAAARDEDHRYRSEAGYEK